MLSMLNTLRLRKLSGPGPGRASKFLREDLSKKTPPSKQNLLASLDIFERDIVATSYSDKGKTLGRRLVDVSDVVKMLCGLIRGTNKGVRWLNLSDGVVAIGTDASGNIHHLVVRRKKKTIINYKVGKRSRKLVVWLPNLLAELVADSSGNWLQKIRVYAFRGDLSDSTQLYVPPLPNTYKDSKICLGGVKMSDFKGLGAADAFENAYIKSTATDHVTSEQLAGKKYRNIIDAIDKTQGKVPLKLLRKVGTYAEILK